MVYIRALTVGRANAPAQQAVKSGPAGQAALTEAAERAGSDRAMAAARAAALRAAAARAAALRAAAARAAAARAAAARAAAAQAAAQAAALRRAALRAAAQAAAEQATNTPVLQQAAGEQPGGTQLTAHQAPQPQDTPTGGAAAAAPSGSAQQIAQQMLAARGWAGQFSCLDSLWERESGWNLSAENPSSGAYGIPQALPGSKMASAGADWESDAATQISWGLGYIQGTYGSPCGAWSHEESAGWY
jgi:hypothetical protein